MNKILLVSLCFLLAVSGLPIASAKGQHQSVEFAHKMKQRKAKRDKVIVQKVEPETNTMNKSNV